MSGLETTKNFISNNYIDWEQYNTLYDPEFKKKGKRLADHGMKN